MTLWEHAVKLWPFWLLLGFGVSSRWVHPGRIISRLVRRG